MPSTLSISGSGGGRVYMPSSYWVGSRAFKRSNGPSSNIGTERNMHGWPPIHAGADTGELSALTSVATAPAIGATVGSVRSVSSPRLAVALNGLSDVSGSHSRSSPSSSAACTTPSSVGAKMVMGLPIRSVMASSKAMRSACPRTTSQNAASFAPEFSTPSSAGTSAGASTSPGGATDSSRATALSSSFRVSRAAVMRAGA
mmetsp:Transcript_15934/g.55535  ORF Transcript_15934/g.55535 Transcript_15934/m.55535 type:complete len:201 (-) Transcript_15934:478-1080(-)